MVELIEKRALILSVTIQVDKKEKQMLDNDNNTNKRKIYNKSLNNNKNTISLLGKLEFILVPTKERLINVGTLHQVVAA